MTVAAENRHKNEAIAARLHQTRQEIFEAEYDNQQDRI